MRILQGPSRLPAESHQAPSCSGKTSSKCRISPSSTKQVILIGLYTGTRSAAILGLQWMPNTNGGWVGLDRGLLYRGAEGRLENNKRQPPCPLPRKLVFAARTEAHVGTCHRVGWQAHWHIEKVLEYSLQGRRPWHRRDAAHATAYRRDLALARRRQDLERRALWSTCQRRWCAVAMAITAQTSSRSRGTRYEAGAEAGAR